LGESLKAKVTPKAGEPLWQTLKAELSFGELAEGLQAVNRSKPKEVKLYELLRERLPVYQV